ncbi:uncharacterized protein PG998_005611 [Apiospora kogelbergensis]
MMQLRQSDDLERRLALLEDNIRSREQTLEDMRRELQDLSYQLHGVRRISADLQRRVSTLNGITLSL